MTMKFCDICEWTIINDEAFEEMDGKFAHTVCIQDLEAEGYDFDERQEEIERFDEEFIDA